MRRRQVWSERKMEAIQGIVGLLFLLYIAFGKAEVSKEVAVREGDNVTFSCEGNTTGKICHVAWAINKGSRKVLTRCANTYDNCNVTRSENVCSTASLCVGTSQCNGQTKIENNGFTSKLEIKEVSSDLRQSVIECIMIDSLYLKSEVILIMESYSIGIYYKNIDCDAKCRNNIINISCKVAKVFPDIKFRIFPECSESDPQVITYLPELSNVTSESYSLAGITEYFDAYCNVTYRPKQNGTFRFRVEIFAKGNPTHPAINFTTNSVKIGSMSTSFKSGSDKKPEVTTSKGSQTESSEMENIAETFKTATEKRTETSIDKLNTLYLLIGSVLTLALTSFIIMSWAICTKRFPCQSSPSAVNKSHEYETIRSVAGNDNNGMHINSWETGFSSWSDADTLFSVNTVEEESQPMQSSAMLAYANVVPVPRPHTNHRYRTYIDPTTPTSTLNGFAQGDSSFDPTNHGENCSTTYVKTID